VFTSFSVNTVLSILVGFGMFGAMLTLPLYLQIVMGMSPTASGFATLPMMAGIMAANVAGSGFLMLSAANARLIRDHGTPRQVELFAGPQHEEPAASVEHARAVVG